MRKTIGIVRVSLCTATVAGVPMVITISGWEATNSLAIILIRSMSPAPQRRSICTLRPLSRFDCESGRKSIVSTNGSSANPLRMAIRRAPCCCASAASGHTAAPLSSTMNSRRRMSAPQAPKGAFYPLGHDLTGAQKHLVCSAQPMSQLGHKPKPPFWAVMSASANGGGH